MSTKCPKKEPAPCEPSPPGSLTSLEQIVDEYISICRPFEEFQRCFYRESKDINEVIERAAKAEMSDGNMHPHQWRIGARKLGIFHRALQKNATQLNACQEFDEIIAIVKATSGLVKGVGPLATYDTAYRIGCFRRAMPDKVHLHCGALTGAQNLALPVEGQPLLMKELPTALSKLEPYEIENLLCLYKDHFAYLNT